MSIFSILNRCWGGEVGVGLTFYHKMEKFVLLSFGHFAWGEGGGG